MPEAILVNDCHGNAQIHMRTKFQYSQAIRVRVGGARNGKGKGKNTYGVSGQVLCVSAGMLLHGGTNQIAASVNELLKSYGYHVTCW